MMVLTEVRLTTAQTQALRRLSVTTGKSITELIQSAIDRYLSEGHASEAGDRIARAMRVAGAFASGGPGASADHDRYLAEAFLQ